MQLTLHTDYSFRVLIYLAQQGDGLATISEITEFYQISRNHLVKVVHHLASKGFIKTTRGKHGGMQLAQPPALISVGRVIRSIEPGFDLVECFSASNRSCAISAVCGLKNILYRASNEFLQKLDGYTLADVINENEQMTVVFPPKKFPRCTSEHTRAQA